MLIGHKKQWEFLKNLAVKGSVSHAYLFSGQEKLGKKTLALEWLSFIFGESTAVLTSGQHPDFFLIEPQNPSLALDEAETSRKSSTAKQEIQIGQIRDLIWKMSLKPIAAPFKAAVIDRAHSMNQEAQTSLLKTLEEPKGSAILILITEYPEYLLPTILSRVETIKFHTVAYKEIAEYLKTEKVPEELFEKISELSMGMPGRAVELVSDVEKIDVLQEKIREFLKISNSDLAVRFQYAKSLSEDKEALKESLDLLLGYLRSVLLQKIRGKDASGRYSVAELKNILKLIQSANFLISTTNVNSRLALETLFMEL